MNLTGLRAGERDDKSLLAAAFVAANDLAREFGWTTPLNREGRERRCERAQDHRAGQVDVTVQRSSVVRLAQPAFAVARFFRQFKGKMNVLCDLKNGFRLWNIQMFSSAAFLPKFVLRIPVPESRSRLLVHFHRGRPFLITPEG